MDTISVIFHSQGWPAVSPAVSFPLSGLEELRQVLADILPDIFTHTTEPASACGYFAARVAARSELGPWSLEIHNLPGLRITDPTAHESVDPEAIREYEAENLREYERVMSEARTWQPPVVFVNLTLMSAGVDPPCSATLNGDVLWQLNAKW